MARARKSSLKSYVRTFGPAALVLGGAYYYHTDQQNLRAVMGEVAKDAAACVENVKGATIVDVRAEHDYALFSRTYALRSSFIMMKSDDAGNKYEASAYVTTPLYAQGDYDARVSRKEYKEEQTVVSEGNLREVLKGIPSNKGGKCAGADEGKIVSCLVDHGWYEGYRHVSSPAIKTGQRVRDDSIRVVFDTSVAGEAGKIEETRKRPPYTFEYNDGAPLSTIAQEAADSVASCHEKALEKHFGPANE